MNNFQLEKTADGSFTFFSPEFGEAFHSRYGARQEAEKKFVEPTQLVGKAEQPAVRLLDICYGLGYNTGAALAALWAVNPSCRVEWVGLELDKRVPSSAIAHNLHLDWPKPVPDILAELANSGQVKIPTINAELLLGDARKTIQVLVTAGFEADAIFLDPFSPPSCPQLWTIEFLALVARCLKNKGFLATYSCSAAVRTALMAAGLEIGSTAPVGRRSPGTLAWWPARENESIVGKRSELRLSEQELEHLQTRAAIPYRDPNLCDGADVIRQRRNIEQQQSSLEPTSQWKKRSAADRSIANKNNQITKVKAE
ncbi:MAG: hypothetical protein F6J93_07645 [Oscillatoria sp. SIO1A7]|nr:hypothetical protein [Oscillatoria sp. SIO1A7]